MSKDNQKSIRQHCRTTELECGVNMTRQGKGSFLDPLFPVNTSTSAMGHGGLQVSLCDYQVPLTSMALASSEDAEQPSSDL